MHVKEGMRKIKASASALSVGANEVLLTGPRGTSTVFVERRRAQAQGLDEAYGTNICRNLIVGYRNYKWCVGMELNSVPEGTKRADVYVISREGDGGSRAVL